MCLGGPILQALPTRKKASERVIFGETVGGAGQFPNILSTRFFFFFSSFLKIVGPFRMLYLIFAERLKPFACGVCAATLRLWLCSKPLRILLYRCQAEAGDSETDESV